jgi:hypothetical protein
MNPFMNNSTHSARPIVLMILNLPPWLCNKRKYIMMLGLIPGPHQPGKVLLNNNGVEAWDEHKHEYFQLQAILFVTVSDSPVARNFRSSMPLPPPRPLTEHASTLPTPKSYRRLWSTPSTASAPVHAVTSTALPSTSFDRFVLDLNRFARTMPPPPAPEHAVDLDRFTDAPDRALHRCPRPRASLNSIVWY